MFNFFNDKKRPLPDDAEAATQHEPKSLKTSYSAKGLQVEGKTLTVMAQDNQALQRMVRFFNEVHLEMDWDGIRNAFSFETDEKKLQLHVTLGDKVKPEDVVTYMTSNNIIDGNKISPLLDSQIPTLS